MAEAGSADQQQEVADVAVDVNDAEEVVMNGHVDVVIEKRDEEPDNDVTPMPMT